MAVLAKDAADRLVSEVRAAFIAGAAQLGFDRDDAEEMLEHGPAADLSWALPTETRKRNEELMMRLGGNIGRWARVYRGWAERGTRDDGSDYNWEKWEAYGREDLAPDIKTTTGLALSEAVWPRFQREVLEKTATEAGDVFLPWRWSPGKQLLAGLVVVVVVGVAVRPYLGPLLPPARSA